MSYTHKGQWSTDKDDRKLGHILGHMLIIPFPVWAGIKLIPAETGNGIEINSRINRDDEIKYTIYNEGLRYMQS